MNQRQYEQMVQMAKKDFLSESDRCALREQEAQMQVMGDFDIDRSWDK